MRGCEGAACGHQLFQGRRLSNGEEGFFFKKGMHVRKNFFGCTHSGTMMYLNRVLGNRVRGPFFFVEEIIPLVQRNDLKIVIESERMALVTLLKKEDT